MEPNSGAKYKQIKEEIKSWILDGTIEPDQKISSENELAEKFGVSRQTARLAITELVHEGWLYREQGRGTFCAVRPAAADFSINQNQNKTVGIITTYLSDYIFPRIIREAEAYLSERGYSILLASTNNDVELERKHVQNMIDNGVGGLIVEPTKSAVSNPNLDMYRRLDESRIPFVMINAYYPELEPPHIVMDDEAGGCMAVKHLIEQGHRRIAGLFKTDDMQGVYRKEGFIRAHTEYNVPINHDLIITFSTEEKQEKPLTAVREILQLEESAPTALFCYNDEIALHILDVVRDFHIKVPEELSIVGYDDSQLAEASEVKLTSVKHPKEEMGEAAAKLLLDMIEGRVKRQPNPSVIFGPELIVRKSIGAGETS
jgi:GntR family transcriptional regulator of arabinose operon